MNMNKIRTWRKDNICYGKPIIDMTEFAIYTVGQNELHIPRQYSAIISRVGP